jgi:adenylate cyclase
VLIDKIEKVRSVARSLDLELVKAESLRATRERPDNPDAADLAMRGWAIFSSNAGLDEPISLFERALALDPQNVRAMTGLTNALVWRVTGFSSKDPASDIATR